MSGPDEDIPPQDGRQDDEAARSGVRHAWLTAVAAVAVTRVGYLAVGAGVSWLLVFDGDPPSLEDQWRRWDAGLHLRIAEEGYAATADSHTQAFFPLLPLLVRALLWLGVPSLVAGMAISLVASVVAAAYLVRLADDVVGPGAGRRAVWYLLVFPTGMFLVVPYAEALFLAGALGAFFHARRGQWWHVAPFAAVAAGSRHIGAAVLAGLAVEYLTGARTRHRGRLVPALAAGAAGAAPILAYMTFLHLTQGDALGFLTAQQEGWDRELTPPWATIAFTWDTWWMEQAPNFRLAWRIELVAAAVAVAAVGWALWRREWAWATYMALPTAALLTGPWLQSVPRALLVYFPLHVLLADLLADRPRAHETVLVVFAMLAAAGTAVYSQHGWFF